MWPLPDPSHCHYISTSTTAAAQLLHPYSPTKHMQLAGSHPGLQRRSYVSICSRNRHLAARGSTSRRLVVVASHNSPFKVQLLHPVKVADADTRPLLVFLPGTDGTGQAITPQLPGLLAAGYDIRTLYIPPDDRSGWEQLQAQVLYLLAQILAARPKGPHNVQVTLLAESFGGCLALRLASAAPHLVKAIVLLNPATCYNQSLNGLSSFVSATNLLGLFPQDLYNTAQAVLLPLLVDIDRVGPEGAAALRSMIFMEPPPDYETAGDQQGLDDPEQWSTTTLSPERRLIQANTSSTFTSAGPARQQQHPNRMQAAGALPAGLGGILNSGPSSRSSIGSSSTGTAGGARSGVFGPAAAANFRSNLLRSGNLPDRVLKRIDTPTLLLSSAKDRMLPSLAEGARLARLLPRSRRVMLPDSGHAALLERGMDLATIMRGAGLTAKPRSSKPAAAAAAAAAATLPQQQQQPAGSTAVTAPSEEMVQVRLPGGSSGSSDGSSRRAKGSMPRIIGVVKDDKALPGSTGRDGTPSPRPATVMPRTNKVKPAAVAAATAASSSSSDSDAEAPRYTPVAAAGAAAAMAAATVATGGGAAATAADAGSSSSSSGVLQPAVSSNGSSRGSSPTGPQQQQQQGSAADKDLAWDEWSQILAPWRDLVSPVLLGQEHLPGLVGCGRPLLFVGNHQKMGLYDMPLLAYELYMRGFKVRGLAHPAHWGGPLGPFFEQFGAVPAGPMTAFKLLRNKEQVLLFPGGAKEVNKRVGQEYQLFWKESPDFVRLAARCGAIIVPFAAVGADDAYDVMMEADELLNVPVIGGLVKAALQRFDPSLDPGEAALPLTRIPGLGLPTPVPIPNLQRLYFKVCAPVDTTQLGLDVKRDAQAWQDLYDSIRTTVYSGMEELLEVQAADEQRGVGSRISKALQSWQPAFNITQAPPGAAGTDEEAAAAEAVRQGVALQQVSIDVEGLSSVSSLSSMDSLVSADDL